MGPGRHMPAGLPRCCPDVSHQEQKQSSTRFSFPICNIGKPLPCPTLHSIAHSRIPDVSHQEQIRPPTRFSFPICNIGKKNTLPDTFKSLCVTSGNCRPASQPSPGHIPIFPMCYIRSENTLAHAYFYSSIISGMMMGMMRTMGSKEWPVRQVAMVLCCKSSPYV